MHSLGTRSTDSMADKMLRNAEGECRTASGSAISGAPAVLAVVPIQASLRLDLDVLPRPH